VGTSEASESRPRCLARDLPPPPRAGTCASERVCIRDGSERSSPRRATRTLSPPHYPLTYCSEADMGALRKSQNALLADALALRALPSPPPLRSLYTLLCVCILLQGHILLYMFPQRMFVCVCVCVCIYIRGIWRQRVRAIEYLCQSRLCCNM
jgi:hypothetical protein